MTAPLPYESDQLEKQFKQLSAPSQATVSSVMQTTANLLANKDFDELHDLMSLLGTIYGQIADGLRGPDRTLH